MKNLFVIKNKNIFFFKLLALLPFLVWIVFCCEKVLAISNSDLTKETYKNLIITEIMYNPEGSNSHKQWIELYNNGSTEICLLKETFRINNDANPTLNNKGDAYIRCHKIEKNITIPAKKYIIITNYKKEDFYNNSTAPANTSVYHSALNLPSKKSSIRLSEDKCKHFFLKATYNSNLGGYNNGKTLERNNNYSKSGWHESCVNGGTPGKKNSTISNCKKQKESDYINKIKINEIYPSPDTKIGETEFVEIKNISNKNINLKDWSVSDSVHKGKPLTDSYILQPNKFYTFKGKFYLNSSNDKANVFDENGNLVDSLSYGKGKSKYAYAFDGTKWRWTSQPTPNSKNIFDKILFGKISQDKNIYKNIYAYFKVKTDNKAQKFTWNFGDGHKSYLKNTRHKYKKTGTYKASLKITGKGEEAFYNFTVKVKNYKPPKIRIVSLCANPQGKDTKNEWLEIKNKSRKKVNLKNWSVATGWDKLYNHPIRKDFKIKAGKTKKLKHSICAFALANSKAKIELRAPDKKVVQKIKYNHKKKPISENEIYQKIKSTWKWILPPTKTTSKLPINTSVKGVTNQKVIPLEIHTTPPILTISKPLKLSSAPNYLQRKKIFQYGKTFSFSPFTQAPIIVPKNSFPTYSSQTNLYLFTTNHSSQHWLIKLTDHLWFKVNSHLNRLWLKF